jgi:hypothetical protein
MEKNWVFERYRFQTIFAFTDSIFIRHHGTGSSANITTKESSKQCISKFLGDCKHKLNIKIEHKNRFMFTVIFDKKNRYIAWTGNSAEDRLILKNLDGMSRKYPTWIKQQIEKIVTHLITKSNIDDVIPVIKQESSSLALVPRFSKRSSRSRTIIKMSYRKRPEI